MARRNAMRKASRFRLTRKHDVNEFTRVFTGWNFAPAIGAGITNFRDPMVPRGGQNHDAGAKTLLNGFSIPACTSPNGTANIACAQSDMAAVMTHLSNHPNVGPFISKQLIQHLVTSNPSPAYVERVARVFNNDCNGLYPQGCTERPRQPEVCGSGDSAGSGSARRREDRSKLRQVARAGAVHQRFPARLQREVV